MGQHHAVECFGAGNNGIDEHYVEMLKHDSKCEILATNADKVNILEHHNNLISIPKKR